MQKTLVCSYWSTWFGKSRTSNPCGNVARRLSLLTNDRPSAFGVHAERCKGGLSSSSRKTELFRRLTTTRGSGRKDLAKERSSCRKITAWSYDMRGHAESFVEIFFARYQRKMYRHSSRWQLRAYEHSMNTSARSVTKSLHQSDSRSLALLSCGK